MAIERITSAPPALSQEELDSLSASTPESFAGIPPLLRHKEEDVFWTVEPEYQGVKQGRGTLWVTEERLSFLSSSAPASAGDSGSSGLSIPYENITLHALSRAPLPASSSQTNGHANGSGTTTATGPCVYCQINEFENEDADEYENSWEITIVPSDSESVDKIFEALSLCASLHPSTSSNDGPQIAGLDMDSLVYADENGNIHGPGSDSAQVEDADEEPEEGGQQSSSAGRIRSDYVADTRKGPY